jgi:hypothetical protein
MSKIVNMSPIKKYAQTTPSQDEVSLFLFMILTSKTGTFFIFLIKNSLPECRWVSK